MKWNNPPRGPGLERSARRKAERRDVFQGPDLRQGGLTVYHGGP